MYTIQLTHPEFIMPVAIGLAVILTAGIIWCRRRQKAVLFFGKTPGRIHVRARIFSYLTILVLVALGIGILLSEPYIAKNEAKMFSSL